MASRKRTSSNLNFFDEGPAKRSRGDDETPIPWIRYDETTNQYFINDEATEFLKSIKGPLSVCSVVGNYRTGKSYLLNRLLGGDATTSNFAVSATTQSCTKGLWIMRRTIAGEDHPVLVVDTEGLGSMSATETHDLRVFSLALLLSSTFLYNSTGAITEATLNNLSLVASVTEHIRMTAEEQADADELAHVFPPLRLRGKRLRAPARGGGWSASRRHYLSEPESESERQRGQLQEPCPGCHQ